MKITQKWLEENNACSSGREWFESCSYEESKAVVQALINDDKLDWANWLIVRIMSRKQKLSYAIYAAEQVISIFEEKHPEDKRPRNAINAAKLVLKKDNAKNREAARIAADAACAADAAYAACAAEAYAAYADAAYAACAADAAYAACAAYAAYAACVADAAYAACAADAAYAACAAYAAYADAAAAAKNSRKEMQLKILSYGLSLLNKKGWFK